MSVGAEKVYAPHQQRVLDEANELNDKLDALSHFIEDGPIYDTLPMEERYRLQIQRDAMELYGAILQQRIDNFREACIPFAMRKKSALQSLNTAETSRD